MLGAAGPSGLVAGQDADLASVGTPVDLDRLEFIHSRKTGALFMASVEIAAIACAASAAVRECLKAYAKNLGLAFQITDDVLDATGTPEALGKDTGKDVTRNTFVTFAGVDGARRLTGELIAASRAALAPLGRRGHLLDELAFYVETRTS
ncbi:MAG: polyprenyl synthetase family protein [Acidobacteriota bacterium]